MLLTNLIMLREILAEEYDLPPEAIQPEMFDFLEIVSMGAKKYAMNNWLESDGKKSSEKDMADSMFHHLARSYASDYKAGCGFYNITAKDTESGKDHLLHLQCRAAMLYTRRQRNIVHPEDISQ